MHKNKNDIASSENLLKDMSDLHGTGDPALMRLALDISDAVVYNWSLADDHIEWDDKVHSVLQADNPTLLATGEGYSRFLDSEGVALRAHLASKQDQQISSFQAEYKFCTGSDDVFWVEDRGRRIFDDTGEVQRVVGVIRLITQSKLREQQLNYLAFYDELTGLLNRSRLRERLDEIIYGALHSGTPGAYLVAGIDSLAIINADYGFDIADEVIAGIAERLKFVAGENATLGRIAGSKFGIVLPECGENNLEDIARGLIDSVHESVIGTSVSPISATISLGVVAFPSGATTSQEAMACAEQALDKTKTGGRSNFNIYDTSLESKSLHKKNAEIGDDIVSALNDRRIHLAYQPIVSAQTTDVWEYECLIRMIDEDGEVVPAGDFVPVAERLGLVRLLDRRALELAIDKLQGNKDIRLAVNVSCLTTTESVGMQDYLHYVEANRNVANRMTVELTETSAIQDLEKSMSFLTRLREIGCKIAIDDFGAGYTSFQNLQALVVDSVKIDGVFVRGLLENKDNQVFVRTLVELAKNFGLETVAEWVGSAEEAELLRAYGVDYLQGFYFGAPELDMLPSGVPMKQGFSRRNA